MALLLAPDGAAHAALLRLLPEWVASSQTNDQGLQGVLEVR